MEMLDEIPNSIINWEPLHVDKGVIPKRFAWGWRPYIPEDDQTIEYLNLVEGILNFSRNSPWTTLYCDPMSILYAKYVITKFVRANLLVPWMLNNFSFKHKPIFLARHPIPVCLSQMRAFDTNNSNKPFMVPDCVNNQRYRDNLSYINGLSSDLERKVAIWCVDNLLTINKFRNSDKLIWVYYENLVMEPEKEMRRIFRELGLQAAEEIVKGIVFEKPSKADFNKDFRVGKKDQIKKYLKHVDQAILSDIQKIFDHYGLNLYEAENPYPIN